MIRIGVFGGSFDPVHYGHLLLAESCREQCALDRVRFVPTAVSPHKQHRQPASPRARAEMLRLAIAGHPAFEISTWELDRGGISYTVDTLTAFTRQDPGAEWILLMGVDSLIDFPTWHRPDEICRLARIAVVERPDHPPIDLSVLAPWVGADAEQVPMRVVMPVVGFSSSEIRQRVAHGHTVRYWLPRSVEVYLAEHQLYRGAKSTESA